MHFCHRNGVNFCIFCKMAHVPLPGNLMKPLLKMILVACCTAGLSALPACTGFGPADADDVGVDTVTTHDDGRPDDVVVDVPVDTGVHDVPGDTNRPDTNVQADDGSNDEGVVADVAPDLIGDTAPDNAPTDSNVPETDACIPMCGSIAGGDLRECGGDGCGSECGYCDYGEVCNISDGKCKNICIPDCLEKGKACGDDGCTGNCGDCGINYKCGIDFQCHPDICEPDCVKMGKECGGDGCGGSCGECGESEFCQAGGLCGADACFGVSIERNTCSLDGQYLYICNVGPPQSLLQIDCYTQTGAECGERGCDCHYNAWSGLNECLEKPPCVPDCEGKECGDDGCGGQCDTCDGGWRCTNDFKCRPFQGADCVWIDWVGWCWSDNWLYTCSSDVMGQGTIIAEDCTASGKICYYNPLSGQRICGTL